MHSAYGTAPITTEWAEFLYSDRNKIKLQAGGTYKVTFKAKTLTSPGPGGNFYFLARSTIAGHMQDVGINSWTDGGGAPYTKSFTFSIPNYEDYYLVWGVHFGGSIAVDDITIEKL
ncbi:hypothetical protein [Paenibacillus sp. GCM10027626]|uniref:hypothetical protein n=1 Tax=Paenibacillus sp. GCM10027626 TaxID=3273411 RepID=UPI00363F64B7